MIALGIDCASTCGWALVERAGGRERLLESGVLHLAGRKAKREAKEPSWIQIARLAAMHAKAELVAVEMPWVGRNAHTAITLARFCGQFEQAFGARAEVEVMVSSQWQSKILGAGRRETLKARAVAWAASYLGAKLTEDEADGAGIAVWALRRRALEGLGA